METLSKKKKGSELIHQNIIQYKEVLYRFFPYQVLSVSCLTVVSAERIYVLERAVVHVSILRVASGETKGRVLCRRSRND
jgi:hypothetical protein